MATGINVSKANVYWVVENNYLTKTRITQAVAGVVRSTDEFGVKITQFSAAPSVFADEPVRATQVTNSPVIFADENVRVTQVTLAIIRSSWAGGCIFYADQIEECSCPKCIPQAAVELAATPVVKILCATREQTICTYELLYEIDEQQPCVFEINRRQVCVCPNCIPTAALALESAPKARIWCA